MTCTGTTCNQGREACRDGCHRPKRTCAELGVCQGRTPPCSDACENPAIVPGGLPAMRLHADSTSPLDETRDLIELALDGLLAFALVGALVFTVFTLIGFWSAR